MICSDSVISTKKFYNYMSDSDWDNAINSIDSISKTDLYFLNSRDVEDIYKCITNNSFDIVVIDSFSMIESTVN